MISIIERLRKVFRRRGAVPSAPTGATTEAMFFNQMTFREAKGKDWIKWFDSCSGYHTTLAEAMLCQDQKREVFAGRASPRDMISAFNTAVIQSNIKHGAEYRHRIVKRIITTVEEVMDCDEVSGNG